MINVILCGGSGTRLWPLSRTMLPKQFVRLFEGRSLFQDTVLRNENSCEKTFIVSNTEQFFLALDQFSEMSTNTSQLLLEPIGRNTAPAVALACLMLNEDEVVLVTPSDQLVKDFKAYNQAISAAKQLAEAGSLVTFGIHPDSPETGFGYIEASGADVLSFKEKPSAKTAQSYIEKGDYYWNSGIFCFKAGVFLAELKKLSPDIFSACQSAIESSDTTQGNDIHVSLEAMQSIPADSIDYAVMEKSDKIKVVPCDMGWSDLGSFDTLFDEVKQQESANAYFPCDKNSYEPICIDSQDNLLVTGNRQVALVDVNDLLIVDTCDALLIAKKGSSQKVNQVVEQIKQQAPELATTHHKVHRPWGTYEVLLAANLYKIKRIVVNPGSKLSSQKHYHRNEHWIVVSGTATVIVDDDNFLVRPNESTYIKMGRIHRLENQGKIDLVMIEVQVGEYTDEDDIVRFDDIYGRQ